MIVRTDTTSRRVAIWFCGYPSILALESLWVGVASRWIERAREYAGPDPMRHMFTTGSGALVGFTVAWFLSRGAQWAYRVACVWSAVLGGGVVVWVFLTGTTSLRIAPGGHVVAAALGVVSTIFLVGSLWELFRRDTRAYFARQ